MIDYFIKAIDMDDNVVKRNILASSEIEARERFLTSCGWNFPDKKFKKISITANSIRRRLERNG